MPSETILYWRGSSGGLANRIIGLSSALVCAQYYRRNLYFAWEPTPECDCSFEELFRLPPNSKRVDSNSILAGESCITDPGYLPYKIRNQFYQLSRIWIPSPQFNRLVAKQIGEFELAECLKRRVEAAILPIKDSQIIGVHLRYTDQTEHQKRFDSMRLVYHRLRLLGLRSALRYFVFPEDTLFSRDLRKIGKAILRNSKAGSLSCAFLACDSNLRKDAARIYFEDQGITVLENTFDYDTKSLRETDVRDAVVDLYCLASSYCIIANSNGSTFPLVGALLGRARIINCRPRHPLAKYALRNK